MKRTVLLATSALATLALPALADGPGHKMTGLGEFGYGYTSLDDVDADLNSFHARGSTHWKLDGNWNVQGNFGFNTDRIEFPGDESTIDLWKVGGTGFWRDSQGAFGAELYYQSLDVGVTIDGFGIAGRGEFYLSPQATIGGRIGYSSLDEFGVEADEWSLNAVGRYYAQPNLGLKLGLGYNSWDVTGGPVGFDEWSLRGEAEYLFRDCDTSVYAGLNFGNLDGDTGADVDYWGFGLGVRMYFGTSGDLVQRHRSGPLDDLSTSRPLLF